MCSAHRPAARQPRPASSPATARALAPAASAAPPPAAAQGTCSGEGTGSSMGGGCSRSGMNSACACADPTGDQAPARPLTVAAAAGHWQCSGLAGSQTPLPAQGHCCHKAALPPQQACRHGWGQGFKVSGHPIQHTARHAASGSTLCCPPIRIQPPLSPITLSFTCIHAPCWSAVHSLWLTGGAALHARQAGPRARPPRQPGAPGCPCLPCG